MGRCKELFHPRNFLLTYSQPKHFVQFEWGWPTIFIIWRVIWALYHLIMIILTGVYSWEWVTSEQNRITWFIYLTHWAYFVLTVSSLMELAAVLHVKFNRPDIASGECQEMPVFLKAVWVMFNVSNAASVAVSILFWALLYTPAYTLTTTDIPTHGINFLYVVINILLSAMPVHIHHFFHSVIFSIVYVIFSVIYHAAGGYNGRDQPYIYSVLNWSDPGTATLYSVIAAFVLTPLSHVLVFALYLLRLLIFRSCNKISSPRHDIEMNYPRN